MSATVHIKELTGVGSGVSKDGSTVRFKSVDNTVVDTSNAITIPSSGTAYSYTKELQFEFDTPPATNIQNLRAYSDGTNPSGCVINYDTTNAFGTNFNTNLGGSDFHLTSSGSPIHLDTLNPGPFTGTGYKGDILRLQLAVSSSASAGLVSPRTATFTYDES